MSTNSFNDFSPARAAEIRESAQRGFTGGTALGARYKAEFAAQQEADAPRIYTPSAQNHLHDVQLAATPSSHSYSGVSGTGGLGFFVGNLLLYGGVLGTAAISVANRTNWWSGVLLFFVLAAVIGKVTKSKSANNALKIVGWFAILFFVAHILVQGGYANQTLFELYVPVAAKFADVKNSYFDLIGYR